MPAVYFYRDKEKREIDIVLEENGTLYPLEIKQKTNPDRHDIRHFPALNQFNKKIAPGGVICLASSWLPLGEKDYVIPVSYI